MYSVYFIESIIMLYILCNKGLNYIIVYLNYVYFYFNCIYVIFN